jgi:transposase
LGNAVVGCIHELSIAYIAQFVNLKTMLSSDISAEQFQAIKLLLESTRKKTCPRRVDLYEVFCAVLYLLKSGCQWRMLPEGFPKWRTVHSYFAICSEPCEGGSLLKQALKNQVSAARCKQGRNACSTLLIVDAHSVKNTDTARHKGYDAGKKVLGIKRHIAVDILGLPHAVAVNTAEVTDGKGALQAFKRCKGGLDRLQSVLCDSGYLGKPFAQGMREIVGEQVAYPCATSADENSHPHGIINPPLET